MSARATALFEATYARAPEGVWSAPGRVNLIGEHTDYNGGFVLPFAIDARAYCAAAPNLDGVLRVVSTGADARGEVAVRDVGAATFDGWLGYALGVAWALAHTGVDMTGRPGIDLALHSDVPQGGGLSSSAAIECAVAVALNDLWELGLSGPELARVGQLAENGAVGAPTGVMDQMASMLGGPGHAVLLDCDSMQAELVPLPLAEHGLALLVMDSGVRHAHAGGGYASRRAACERAASALRVASLRALGETDLPRIEASCDAEAFRRARHVITENTRVLATVDALREAGPEAIGPFLSASHASMRDDFEISVPAIDAAVEAAEDAGALGARLTGGGFGGASIALGGRDSMDEIREAVTAACAAGGHPEPTFTLATPAAGARREEDLG